MSRPLVLLALGACLTLASGWTAAAQSVFGCTDLESQRSNAAVEGDNGVFYRVDPDLHMFHALSEDSADRLAELAEALATLGTTLIYVPLPTKALAMPDQLPQRARDYGFDPALATTQYIEILDLLERKGVATVDIRRALRAGAQEEPSFFQTDDRLTSAGARRAAQAIALAMAGTDSFETFPKGRYETRPNGKVILPSAMRSALQQHCMMTLPQVETETYVTNRLLGVSGGSDNTIFGGSKISPRVALVGTEYTGDAAINMTGFLSEFSGLDAVQYSVAGGGSFAAISSYLTSLEFQEARPAYLVWTNPVENNLAQFGDQPMRELIAAAGATCRVSLPIMSASRPETVTLDLTVLDRNQSYTLSVDADRAPATMARFDFLSASGLIRTKSIYRHPDQVKTGRFYMPMSGLWPEGAQSVDITLDAPFGGSSRVTACFD